MQTSIRFIRPAGSVHGSFAPGDVLRCSVEFAAHFVGMGAAEYRRAPLPVGLQLIGNYFDEGTLLHAAHALQQATDTHLRAPAGL